MKTRKSGVIDSTYEEKESSRGCDIVQTPEQSVRSHKANNIGGEIQKYTRTPTAIESALSSNTPVRMDLSLFENYKVASKLPDDIFQ
jgi:hypothetical protein